MDVFKKLSCPMVATARTKAVEAASQNHKLQLVIIEDLGNFWEWMADGNGIIVCE